IIRTHHYYCIYSEFQIQIHGGFGVATYGNQKKHLHINTCSLQRDATGWALVLVSIIDVDLAGWHGHLAGGQDLLAVGGVDVLLQVGVTRILAHARPLRLHPAAAHCRRRRVPNDRARTRAQLQRVTRRRVHASRRHHQHHRREGQERHHQLPHVLHGVSETLTKKCRSTGSE
uniref:Uncharacterized protein n=1 Tax=Triticum urartu TaxID=4572 RepID=A0A8R7K461_TRIUA